MQTKKNLLVHELSNLLSYIQMTVGELDSPKEEKNRINHWIFLASLFIHFEPVFLGKPIPIIIQKEDVGELISTAESLNHHLLSVIPAYKPFNPPSFTAEVDPTLFTDSIDYLLKYLISHDFAPTFSHDVPARCLVISYNDLSTQPLEPGRLDKSIVRENLHNFEIPFQLALELLSRQNIRTEFELGKIKLYFSSL